MLKRYIVILLLSILIVVFAIQNADTVVIHLLMFKANASLSFIIILTFFIGALITLVLALQEIRRRNRRISELEDQLKEFNKENSSAEPPPGESLHKQGF